jgi:hypothetical protein
MLCDSSFYDCRSLSDLSFESGSELRQIGDSAFHGCSSLDSVIFPASVEVIHVSAFIGSAVSSIAFEDCNSHFRVYDSFLLDFEGLRLVRSFDDSSSVVIPSDIEFSIKTVLHILPCSRDWPSHQVLAFSELSNMHLRNVHNFNQLAFQYQSNSSVLVLFKAATDFGI